jgi:hypothetical protein
MPFAVAVHCVTGLRRCSPIATYEAIRCASAEMPIGGRYRREEN